MGFNRVFILGMSLLNLVVFSACEQTGKNDSSDNADDDGNTPAISAPSILYDTNQLTFTQGQEIKKQTPTNTGGIANVYVLSNPLPTGLQFDPTTGEISGTPTAKSPTYTEYTVTARNDGGSSSAVISFRVLPPVPNVSFVQSSITLTQTVAMSALTPANNGGLAVSYSVSPALPDGLGINSTSGAITGTPTNYSLNYATYTVTAQNEGGQSSAQIQIRVYRRAPQIAYSATTYTFKVGEVIAGITPTNSGGTATQFSISQALFSGVVLNPNTGVIAGNPTTASPNYANYIVTATNESGSSSVTLSMRVLDRAPIITYGFTPALTTSEQTYFYLNAPSNSGGAVTGYSISPALPNGIALNSMTGEVSGVSTVTQARTTYTITGSNSGGSATVTFSLQVDALSKTLAYKQVVTGSFFTCGLLYNGKVHCWGLNNGNSSRPPKRKFESLAAGIEHVCGLRKDKSVKCWGNNLDGRASPPKTKFEQLSLGSVHSCGLKADGTVACWGDNTYGQLNYPSTVFTSLASEGLTTCGLRSDKTAQCWGLNNFNKATPPAGVMFDEIALASYTGCGIRTQDKALQCWGYAAAESTPPSGVFTKIYGGGGQHYCATKADGYAKCWGSNTYFQLTIPARLFAQLSLGQDYTCGIRAYDRGLECWGRNLYGEAVVPTFDAAKGRMMEISLGGSHGCAIKTDTSIACWGYMSSGFISKLNGSYTKVVSGYDHNCALRADQTIHCWGTNLNGRITAPSGTFTDISAGGEHTCALKTDGTISCWGSNNRGQTNAPQGEFRSVAVRGAHSCALKMDDKAVCWGSDLFRQVADVPTDEFMMLAPGNYSVCGIKEDNTMKCWGSSFGQSNYGASYFDAAAGSNHLCIIGLNEGTIGCWGENSYGQQNKPAGSFVELQAGSDFSCAIKADGTVSCWGKNDNGQTQPPTL